MPEYFISNILPLLVRFIIDFAAITILVRYIYYPRHRNTDFLFTFILFNVLNFLICLLLNTKTLNIGFAFGLFAIFSILRYRTVMLPIKEMGFFFTSLALGIINSLITTKHFYIPLIGCNAFILVMTMLLDRLSFMHENMKQIIYERIDLIHLDRRPEMIADLTARTGLPIHKVEVKSFDFMRDIAIVYVYYFSKHSELGGIDMADDGDDD